MFLLVNTGLFIFIIATLVISYAVCQNSLAGAQGAWFPELFQAKTRASGASLAYQISAMVSGLHPVHHHLAVRQLRLDGPGTALRRLRRHRPVGRPRSPGKPGASGSAGSRTEATKSTPTHVSA